MNVAGGLSTQNQGKASKDEKPGPNRAFTADFAADFWPLCHVKNAEKSGRMRSKTQGGGSADSVSERPICGLGCKIIPLPGKTG